MIEDFHIHIYFDEKIEEIAVELRDEIIKNFFAPHTIMIGDLHYKPLGPHTRPQFVIIVNRKSFGNFISWVMLNRKGLSVLVHPNTDDELKDHTENCFWMGTKLELDLTKL